MTHNPDQPNILITGGAGFVGRAVLGELAAADPLFHPTSIRVLDLNPLAEDISQLPIPIEVQIGDIRNYDDVERACQGIDVVLHLASLVDWGTHPESEVDAVNVEGTRNVIRASKEAGVKILVYTGSLEAIFAGEPIHDADETYPYPTPFKSTYSRTKAAAEGLVTEANGNGLKTTVLRPSGIFGEADPYHLPGLVAMARKGVYFRVGNSKKRCMNIYVGNVAHAHLLAARALWDGNQTMAGETYFLVDSLPDNFFHHLDPILERAGYSLRPANAWIPGWLLYPVALLNEGAALLLRPFVQLNPKLSRFALKYISTDFTLNGEKAHRDFGFTPKYDRETAIERTAAWFRR